MIPDAAVEAALDVYLTKCNYNAEEIVRLVLEAAAPHLAPATRTDRDELSELIWCHTDGTDEDVPDIAADRIIAAGWHK